MQNPLEILSKKDLIALLDKERKGVEKAEQRISDLEFQLAQYKRLVHGQKRERFEGDKNQMSLPFVMDPDQAQRQEEEVKEKLTYERRKRKSAHKGRMPLPEHLEVREIEIYPEEDITDMVCALARKLLMSSNMSLPPFISSVISDINMLPRKKREWLSESYRQG